MQRQGNDKPGAAAGPPKGSGAAGSTAPASLVPLGDNDDNSDTRSSYSESSRPSMSRDFDVALRRVIEATNLLSLPQGEGSERESGSNSLSVDELDLVALRRVSEAICLIPAEELAALQEDNGNSEVGEALKKVLEATSVFRSRSQSAPPDRLAMPRIVVQDLQDALTRIVSAQTSSPECQVNRGGSDV